MSIDTLLKLFEEFGWPGMFAVVCILVVYYFISKKDKKSLNTINAGFTNLTNTIITQNETLVKAVTTSNERTQEHLFDLISRSIDENERRKEREHKNSITKRHDVGENVDEVLWDILQMTNAQRVIMIEFHNSKENLDGLSFLWYDVQHEKQQRGVQTISAKCRNLQATNLRPIVKRVNNSKSHIVVLNSEDIENIYNESTVLYSNLKECDAQVLVYIGIYNTESNELLGLIAIEYQNGYPYHDDLIDYFSLKEKACLVEHYYNQAREELKANREYDTNTGQRP